jgi:putative CocE/NonD family hydrolase
MGVSAVTLPPDPIQSEPTLESAQAAFEQQPQVRIMFENGAGGSSPGLPYPEFERWYPRFPVPGTRARTWFADSDGRLAGRKPKKPVEETFDADPRSTAPTNFTGDSGSGNLWTDAPTYHWTEHKPGTSVSWLTGPLNEDTPVIGAGAVELWVRSDKPDVDLQATISEVRPDGKETFVQGGWVRGSMRALDRERSTKLEPVLSLRKSDVEPLPSDRFVRVTVPLYYQGHAYRAGSRIRVTISGVNGDQPIWAFAKAKPRTGSTGVTISTSKRKPSKLTLPVTPSFDFPDELPPCPGLRGEPCRDYAG